MPRTGWPLSGLSVGKVDPCSTLYSVFTSPGGRELKWELYLLLPTGQSGVYKDSVSGRMRRRQYLGENEKGSGRGNTFTPTANCVRETPILVITHVRHSPFPAVLSEGSTREHSRRDLEAWPTVRPGQRWGARIKQTKKKGAISSCY